MMEATKYLIKVDGVIAGYNNPDILRIDLALRKPSHFEIFEQEQGLSLYYVPILGEHLKKFLKIEKNT